MQPTSDAWTALVAAFRAGIGAGVLLGIHIPGRNLLLTSQPWPPALVPTGAVVYPYLAPFGQGVGSLQIDLADDRSSRISNVPCQVATVLGQRGVVPQSDLTRALLSLSEQGATILGAFTGGVNQDQQDLRTLFHGRFTTPQLTLGRLSVTLVDGASADHRPIEITVGTELFPGSPLDAHGQAAPLVIGTALGLQPLLVRGMATGTLALPLSATETTALNLTETAAPFAAQGTVLVESESVAYTGRKVTLLPEGTSTLQLLNLTRAAPVFHAAGVAVQVAPPPQYVYLVGNGLPVLELLAVRDADGPIHTYQFTPTPPDLPEGTALLTLDTSPQGLNVDVQVQQVPPPPPLVNGGFDTGTLTGWTPLPGSTAQVLPAPDAVAGTHLLRLSGLSTTPTGVYQDVAVETGERYTLLLYWRAPVQNSRAFEGWPLDVNIIINGGFTDPDPIWTPQYEGMPEPIVPEYTPGYTLGEVTVNGAQTFQLPFAPFYEVIPDPDNPALSRIVATGYRSFSVELSQTLDVEPGLPLAVDVRVQAWLKQIAYETMTVAVGPGSGVVGGVVPSVVALVPACEQFVVLQFWRVATGVTSPVWESYLQPDQPSSTLGRLAEFTCRDLQPAFFPADTRYRFTIKVFGRYIGSVPPIVINSAVVLPVRIPNPSLRVPLPPGGDAPTGLLEAPVSLLGSAGSYPSFQAVGFLQLGTPADPGVYTTRILQGRTGWNTLAVSVLPETTTLRVSLLAETEVTGSVFDYDGVRFLPAGQNPVRVMAGVFARFLPHLTLDQESVEVAAAYREGWLFSGWVPQPGRTDSLLTKMSQECFCTVYKDVRGVYRIVAEEPGTLPVVTLDSATDILQGTTTIDWLSAEQVYTDYYLWYQRVSTQVTSSQAGQYAAVLYVTPAGAIHDDIELQTLCAGAEQLIGARRRLDYYADFIADPGTATLLLERLVYQYTSLPTQVTVQASLPAVPLDVTDRVAVRSPLVGAAGFMGDVRQLALTPAATPPGLSTTVSARSVPGAPVVTLVEPWEYFGAETQGASRTRETWEHETLWHPHSSFAVSGPAGAWCRAILGTVNSADSGGQERVSLALGPSHYATPSEYGIPPLATFNNSNVDTMTWDSGLAAITQGAGISLVAQGVPPNEVPLVALLTRSSTSEVWRMKVAPTDSEARLGTIPLPNNYDIWSMCYNDFGDGEGNSLFMASASGRVYRYNAATGIMRVGHDPTTTAGYYWAHAIARVPTASPTSTLWIAYDSASDPSDVDARMYHATYININAASMYWDYYPFPDSLVSNFVTFDNTLWIAAQHAVSNEVHIWRLDGVTWSVQATLPNTGVATQPTSLAVFEGRLYLALSSLDPPVKRLMQVWYSASGTAWSLHVDVMTDFPDDPNTGVTALGVARGRLYMATGMPFASPVSTGQGVRVYCFPTAEALTGS